MSPIIVGVAGSLQSGKDTFGNRLISLGGFVRIAFADALKQELVTRLRPVLKAHLSEVWHAWELPTTEVGWDHVLYDWFWVHKDRFARALLQAYGTEVRRADDPLYWVRAWEEMVRLEVERHPVARIVSTDMRFRNEAEAIRRLGGFLVRILPRRDQPLVAADVAAHASERDLDDWTDWDFVVTNQGDVKALEAEADEFCRAVLKP